MLRKGFKDQIHNVLKQLNQETQGALLSANIPYKILEVISLFMRDSIKILVKEEELTSEG